MIARVMKWSVYCIEGLLFDGDVDFRFIRQLMLLIV